MGKRLTVCLLCAALALPGAASALSNAPLEDSAPEKYDCAAALLVEPSSGQIVFAVNANEKRPVASVTKIMTILLACEAVERGDIDLSDRVQVSANAAGMGGSQVLLDAGETQTVSELLKSVIVGSANDSAVALAEYIAGSAPLFVDRMNRRAAELGMEDTAFVNCTGLPADGQHTTARDVAAMAVELSKHDLYYDYSTIWLEDFTHESGRVTTLTNTNKLIRQYDGCDGLKTGSTSEAGYCMAASAKRGGMRLVAVVLGATSGKERFRTASQMLDYGFASYRLYPVAEKGATVRGRMPVTGSQKDSVALALDGDVTLLVKKGGESAVSLAADLPQSLSAPVTAGEAVGWVNVLKDGETVAQIRVVSAEDAPLRGLSDGLGVVFRAWCFQ
ncbi:MAG: D-alanyl-D-alanine carboxypeptidase [Clostridia bacterium]|nr:D-alanyl-D-alanine carboxypeptidase [Clostridia bacterium]